MSPGHAEHGWIHEALDRYEVRLVAYATRIVGDAHRARDVVQEVFLRLTEQRREEVEDHLTAWLFQVCRNRALDVRKKERPMQPIDTTQVAERPGSEPGPSEAIERKESALEVERKLQRLPENQQEVLRLKFQHGLSYKEIGAVTGHSVGNVGFLIHRALGSLRDLMQDDFARNGIRETAS